MQQINLYQGGLIDKPEALQARQVGYLLLGFSALLLILWGASFLQLRGTRQQVVALQQQQQAASAQLFALKQKYPLREKNALLEQEISRLEQELDTQKQLLGYFTAQDQKGNDHILQILEGLARNGHQGVWLRRIQLDGSGRHIRLAGSALRPEQVPDYVQLLGKRGVFKGQEFASLKLTRLKERPGQIDFSLESVLEAAP